MSPFKIGDVVVKAKSDVRLMSTVIRVDEEDKTVLARRHFNGLAYWDNDDYWRLATEEEKEHAF